MTGRMWNAMAVSLGLAGLALAVLAAAAALLLLEGEREATLFGVLLLLAAAVGGFALRHAWSLTQSRARVLERLRAAVLTVAGNETAVLPRLPEDEADSGVVRLHAALGELTARQAALRTAPDRRLAAVLGAVGTPILVITEQAQVSLVNAPARALLGAERVRIGTSAYAALSRTALGEAFARAAETDGPVPVELYSVESEALAATAARLGEHGGLVIAFAASAIHQDGALEHDLTLHDRPPDPQPLGDETPLAELPVVVLDTETTGLDVTRDRVISVGAVRLHGPRLYRNLTFDGLVHPGGPIPPRSTAVHGITDAMVESAQPYSEIYEDMRTLTAGCVLVGHNVAFDLAILRREHELATLPWRDPLSLDTLLLSCALDPNLPSFELDGLASHLGVEVHGRHTALGDALVTAEIYLRLLPRLADAGVTTLGKAQAFAAKATDFVKRQKEAGW